MRRQGLLKLLGTGLIAALLAAVLCASASAANLQQIPLPFPGGASDLIVGPDGALWFASKERDEIDRYDIATGSLSQFHLLIHHEDEGENEGPSDLTAGADGKVWYLTDDGREIGRISSGGAAETVKYEESGALGEDISAAPGGGVWETLGAFSFTSGDIRFVSETGAIMETDYEGDEVGPVSTATDGIAWVGERYMISSVSSTEVVSYPTALGFNEVINSIAFGSDGSVWYAGHTNEEFAGTAYESASGGSIGHLFPGGSPQGFKIGSNTLTGSISAGADGAMWFAVVGGVGRIEPSGAYQLGPTAGYQPGTKTSPSNLVYGPDGAIWFIDNEKSALVKVAIDGALFPPPPAPAPAPIPAPPPAPKPKPAPGLKLGLLVKPQRVKEVEKRKGILLTCSLQGGSGKCSVQLTIAAKGAQALHLKVSKKAKTVTLAKTSRTYKKASALTFVVKLPGKTLRALRHLHKPLPVTVKATATSPGHSASNETKKISIRP